MQNNKEELERLMRERKELLHYLREVEENLLYLSKEKEYLQPSVDKFHELKLFDLKKKQKRIEYMLITQSKNAKNEKKYLDKLIDIERKLKEYSPLFEAHARYNIVTKQIETLAKQRDEIKQKLQETDNKIKEQVDRFRSSVRKRVRNKEDREGNNDIPNDEPDQELGKDYISLEELLGDKFK
ncbi:MAG: hypothetical protein QXU27_02410 [Candidatus Anstonellales archaeon]